MFDNLGALKTLIGDDNVADVQKRIANLIVNAVADDLTHYQSQNYAFYPPDYIQGIIEEAVEESEKKMKKMYKDAMLEVAETAVEKFKQAALTQLEGEVIK